MTRVARRLVNSTSLAAFYFLWLVTICARCSQLCFNPVAILFRRMSLRDDIIASASVTDWLIGVIVIGAAEGR